MSGSGGAAVLFAATAAGLAVLLLVPARPRLVVPAVGSGTAGGLVPLGVAAPVVGDSWCWAPAPPRPCWC